MRPIVPNIDTPMQYLNLLATNGPCAFRPAQCPTCSKQGLWGHGSYPRKADRTNTSSDSLNPIPICRFLCTHCGHTCSVLPECLAPRRWYLWIIQGVALLLLLARHSLRQVSIRQHLARSTLRRWLCQLKQQFKIHAFHLRSRFPNLGRNGDSISLFWNDCLTQMSLARAMYWVNHAGGKIP